MKRSSWDVEHFVKALQIEVVRDGYEVVEHDGSVFGRITFTATNGEEAVSEINLTQIATAMHKELS